MSAAVLDRPTLRLPLLVSEDDALADSLERLALAAGTVLDRAVDPAAARARYLAAPVVLIGIDQAENCSLARLPRRSRVVLTGTGLDPGQLLQTCTLIGAEHVADLPAAEPWLVQLMRASDDAGPAARVVAVLGGRGGAGASILAGGLAVTAVTAGHRTLLIDGDPLGGGLDLVLGWEAERGLRWPALTESEGRVDPEVLLGALPSRGDLVLLSFERDASLGIPAEAMAVALDTARRGRDVVVADLPRHLDDAATLALQAADQAIIVVPAELRAAASAAKVVAAAGVHCDNLSLVVRGPGRLSPREIAHLLGLPLAGTLRPEPALALRVEKGDAPAADGRGPLAELCRHLISELTA